MCALYQIVIATPGRLCELVFDRLKMKLSSVRTVVLDEVDALLRPPYDQEIDSIVEATPVGNTRLIFLFFLCLYVRVRMYT